MDNITHEVRLKNWQTIIAQCAARPEGQTVKSWMQENGISEKSYYYWLRRIRREVILSILVYTFFSRMFDLMLHPAMNHSTAVA